MPKRILLGVAFNDMDNVRSAELNEFYTTWTSMLNRCYNRKRNYRNKTYEGVTVCNEWLVFSNFKKWMAEQDWRGKELDKDLIVKNNKLYSPDTCCFISRELNAFLTTNKGKRNVYPLGVRYRNKNKDMVSELKNCYHSEISVNGKTKHLGYFDCPYAAHLAWQKYKLILINEWLKTIECDKVQKGLMRVRDSIVTDINNNAITEFL